MKTLARHLEILLVTLFASWVTGSFAQSPDPIIIEVDAGENISELRPIWNYFGYDEALTTLTPEGMHLLKELTKMSDPEPIQVRVHHLLTSGDGTLALKWSSTNVYTEDDQGNPIYNWANMDKIMDVLTQPGIEPFVQAGFMPQDLSSQGEPYTPELTTRGRPEGMLAGGAFYPPKDYIKWENLIEAWARHCGERYGVERASSWLWEAWNEPESPYWKGTTEEFFQLYDHFAAGVKRALPEAKVGGPHVTDPGWRDGDVFMREFLEHCRSGKNAATGGTGAPLDFIAFHAKGTTRVDEEGRVEMNLANQLSTIQTYSKIIASFPEFSDLPVYIGESDPEGCAGCPATHDPERAYRLTSQFAAYSAAAFMRKQDLMAEDNVNLHGAISWAFTFHDQPWFNGLRALTTNEVALPVFNAFKLFSQLDRQRISVSNPHGFSSADIIADKVRNRGDVQAIATRGGRHVQVLLWHYHDVEGSSPTIPVSLKIQGLPSGETIQVTESRIDAHHANAYTAWLAMNSPQDPTDDQIAALHKAASLEEVTLDPSSGENGKLQLEVSLPRQAVSLIKFNW